MFSALLSAPLHLGRLLLQFLQHIDPNRIFPVFAFAKVSILLIQVHKIDLGILVPIHISLMDFVGAVIQPAQPIVPVTASGQFRLLYFQDIADRNDILRLVSIQEQ